jgi:hypothetical protein
MGRKEEAERLGMNYHSYRRWLSDLRRQARATQALRDEVVGGAAPAFTTVVVVSDLHGNPDASLVGTISLVKPDIIVLAGDVLDSRIISPHRAPRERVMALAEEMRRVRGAIDQWVTQTSAQIWVIRGNHDDYAARQLMNISPELHDFFADPLEILVTQYEGRAKLCGAETYMGRTPYLMFIGDVCISHFHFTGAHPGAAVHKLYQKYMTDWRLTFGVTPSLFIQAHTHNLSYQERDGGRVALVECGMGCAAEAEEYKLGQKFAWRPGVLGAFMFQMQDDRYIKRSGAFLP